MLIGIMSLFISHLLKNNGLIQGSPLCVKSRHRNENCKHPSDQIFRYLLHGGTM